MTKYWIRYGLGGGFGGCENCDWEEIEANSLEEATTYAHDLAFSEIEMYGGLHGLPCYQDLLEQYPDASDDEIEEAYQDEAESWLAYEASRIKPEDFNE